VECVDRKVSSLFFSSNSTKKKARREFCIDRHHVDLSPYIKKNHTLSHSVGNDPLLLIKRSTELFFHGEKITRLEASTTNIASHHIIVERALKRREENFFNNAAVPSLSSDLLVDLVQSSEVLSRLEVISVKSDIVFVEEDGWSGV